MPKSEIIEAKGKNFIYRAVKLNGLKDKYIIVRGKNINGEFVEYSNMFKSEEERRARTFKNRSEAEKYIRSLARLEKLER